jgi:hypothetical protein
MKSEQCFAYRVHMVSRTRRTYYGTMESSRSAYKRMMRTRTSFLASGYARNN